MPLELARISAKELDGLPKAHTVFFFAVGALEDFGPHLPMGLGVLEAEKLCRLAAERLERDLPGWRGVIMPPVPLSISSNTTNIALTTRGHVLRDWLIDTCKGLSRCGFCHFACFSGHWGPRQLTAIEEAGKAISRRGPLSMLLELVGHRPSVDSPKPTLVSVMSGLINAKEVMKSPLWPDPLEHGGRRDTSIALALQVLPPEGVAPNALAARPRPLSRWQRLRLRLKRGGLLPSSPGGFMSYWGAAAPSEGTAAWGQATLETTVKDAFPKLRAVWEGANPNFLFRSYYSVFPPNKSFFKGWLLTLLLVSLLVAWYWLAFQSFVSTG